MMLSEKKLLNIKLFRAEIYSPSANGHTTNRPLLLCIEPTTRCNFKCVQCAKAFDKKKGTDLKLSFFLDIVPLVQTAYEVYLFGDGEVLLDIPRHLSMISRIHQLDPACELGFSTNGKLLTPYVYELYATAGIRYIQISIDAASKRLYEEMRKGGNFSELCENIKKIVSLRNRSRDVHPRLILATVISRQNYHHLTLLAGFAKKCGFSSWYINAEYPHNPGRDKLRLTTDDLISIERMKNDIMRKFHSDFFIYFDPCIGLSLDKTNAWIAAESPVYCTVPWQRFEMKANGDIILCPYFFKPICSIKGKTFMEVWNGEAFRSIRKAFATGRGIPSYCRNCKLGLRKQYIPGFPGMPDLAGP